MLSTNCAIGTKVLVWTHLPAGKPFKRGTMAWQAGTVIENHHVQLDRGATVGICKVQVDTVANDVKVTE